MIQEFVFFSHTVRYFQNCRIPKHQNSDCTSKMPAKKLSGKTHFYKALLCFFNFLEDECCEMLRITFLGKENEIQESGSGKQHSPATGLYVLACM